MAILGLRASFIALSVAWLPLLLSGCPLKSFEVDEASTRGGNGGASGAFGGSAGMLSAGGLDGISGSPAASTPSLTNDRYVVRQGATLEVAASEGVLSNDAPVALRVVDFSASGSELPPEFDPELEIDENGGFHFTSQARFFGVYKVTYTAENRAKLRRNAELSIHVVPSEIDLGVVAEGVGGFVLDGARGDALGAALGSAGDVNGDGRSDLVIGAPGYSAGDGAAYVLFGDQRALPVSLVPSLAMEQEARFAAFIGGPGSAQALGVAVAGVGDFDLDGSADIALGSSGPNNRAYFVPGASALAAQELPLPEGFTLEGDSTNVDVGHLVNEAGDVNGDGTSDLIFSWKSFGYGFMQVIFGPEPSGGAAVSVATAPGVRIRGDEPNDGFPLSVAAVGDLDGDGSGEIFAASRRSFVLLRGGGSYPQTTEGLRALDSTQGWFLGRKFGAAGASVTRAGDVDGDGSSDIAYCDGVSFCRVVFSPPVTLGSGWNFGGFSENATRVLISGGGDVDGDGLSDLLLAEDNKAYVVHGRRAGHGDVDLFALGSAGFTLDLPNGGSIATAAVVGDLNQDGISDLAIGDVSAERGAGRVYVVFGVASE
jgi:hypothetical protein